MCACVVHVCGLVHGTYVHVVYFVIGVGSYTGLIDLRYCRRSPAWASSSTIII